MMIPKSFLILVLATIICASSCNAPQSAIADDTATSRPVAPTAPADIPPPPPPRPQKPNHIEDPIRKIISDPDANKIDKNDAFTVQNVSVRGDTLIVDVSYGGGCKDHEWKMSTNGTYAKSYPPKLNIYLVHNANEDFCKAMKFEKLKFDLKSCRYDGSDMVLLQMNGAKDFITYAYSKSKPE